MAVQQGREGKWRRFRKLPADARVRIVRAMVALLLTKIGLRALGFRRWKATLLHAPSPRARTLAADAQRTLAEGLARDVRTAELNGPGKPNCLERSLALWWLLRQQGIQAEVRLGARKSGARFEAHAWVEMGGAVLNDTDDVHTHYSRFDSPLAASEADSR